MSEENVTLVRRSFEAFGRGDIPGVLDTMDPEIEWHDPNVLPYGGSHRGHEAMAQHIQQFAGHFEQLRVEPEQFLDAAEHVVVLGRFSGRASGGEFEVPFVHIWEMRGGKALRVDTHTDTASVLRAIG